MATGSLCAGRGGRQGKFTDGAEGLRPALRRPDGACGRRGPELPGSPEPRSSPRPPLPPRSPRLLVARALRAPVSPRTLRTGHAAPAEPAAPGRRPRSAAADVSREQRSPPGGTRRGAPRRSMAATPLLPAGRRRCDKPRAGQRAPNVGTAVRPGPMPLKRPAQGPVL